MKYLNYIIIILLCIIVITLYFTNNTKEGFSILCNYYTDDYTWDDNPSEFSSYLDCNNDEYYYPRLFHKALITPEESPMVYDNIKTAFQSFIDFYQEKSGLNNLSVNDNPLLKLKIFIEHIDTNLSDTIINFNNNTRYLMKEIECRDTLQNLHHTIKSIENLDFDDESLNAYNFDGYYDLVDQRIKNETSTPPLYNEEVKKLITNIKNECANINSLSFNDLQSVDDDFESRIGKFMLEFIDIFVMYMSENKNNILLGLTTPTIYTLIDFVIKMLFSEDSNIKIDYKDTFKNILNEFDNSLESKEIKDNIMEKVTEFNNVIIRNDVIGYAACNLIKELRPIVIDVNKFREYINIIEPIIVDIIPNFFTNIFSINDENIQIVNNDNLRYISFLKMHLVELFLLKELREFKVDNYDILDFKVEEGMKYNDLTFIEIKENLIKHATDYFKNHFEEPLYSDKYRTTKYDESYFLNSIRNILQLEQFHKQFQEQVPDMTESKYLNYMNSIMYRTSIMSEYLGKTGINVEAFFDPWLETLNTYETFMGYFIQSAYSDFHEFYKISETIDEFSFIIDDVLLKSKIENVRNLNINSLDDYNNISDELINTIQEILNPIQSSRIHFNPRWFRYGDSILENRISRLENRISSINRKRVNIYPLVIHIPDNCDYRSRGYDEECLINIIPMLRMISLCSILFGIDENSKSYPITLKNLSCFNLQGPIKHFTSILKNINIDRLMDGINLPDEMKEVMKEFRNNLIEIVNFIVDSICNSQFSEDGEQIISRDSRRNHLTECGICNMRNEFSGYQYFVDNHDGTNCQKCERN